MATKFVTITGIMTYDDAPVTPPDPNAPRPTHPIALPGDPWWGTGGPPPVIGGGPILPPPGTFPPVAGWPDVPGNWPSLPGRPPTGGSPPIAGWPTVPGWPGGSLPGGGGGWGGPPVAGWPDVPGNWPSLPGRPPIQPPDPNAPRPTHPIMLPGMPGWGAWPNVPTHPIMLPGMPGWPTTPPVQPPTIEHPPAFEPIPGQQPGPFGKYAWFWSPTYGWVMGVPSTGGETSPPEGEVPPVEPTPTKKK